MRRKYLGAAGLLAGVALAGLALWLTRRRSEQGQEASSRYSWLPDDALDLPADSSGARDDDVMVEIFDRPPR